MTIEQYPRNYLYKRIVQAKLFIDNNYAKKIDINNISDEAYFSKFHFIRVFKQIYGKTPHQYLTWVRIEKATQLLCFDNSISDVCHAVGFDSLSSFGVLFKKIVGVSPSAFLDVQHKKKTQMLNDPLKFVPGCFVYQNGWDEKQQF